MTPSGTSSARKIAAASNLSPKLGTTQKRRKGRRPYPHPTLPRKRGRERGGTIVTNPWSVQAARRRTDRTASSAPSAEPPWQMLVRLAVPATNLRSEEHTSELQAPMYLV